MAADRIRVGVLGTAAIARAFFERPSSKAEILAVASRDIGRARAFAAEYTIPRSYGSYDALLDDTSIDAVYIPLPHHLHSEFTVRAARRGKHVLVEKPAALTVAEVETMHTAIRDAGVVYMEALMYRTKTIHRHVRDIVRSGKLGRIRFIDFSWCFPMALRPRGGFRLDPAVGGGVLYDLGIYGVDFMRYITGTELQLEHALVVEHGHAGIDSFTHLTCRAGETFGSIACGFTVDANWYVVAGEKGSVTVPGSVSGRLVENILQIHFFEGDRKIEERFTLENPYVMELDEFSQCIRTGTVPEADIGNSLRNIRFLEEVRRRVGLA